MQPTSSPSFAPSTGLRGLDAVLDGVARGDNIVWQIERLDDYLALVAPYAEAARGQRRRLIYFRFAEHPPLLAAEAGAEIHRPRPADGFDAFVDQVHGVIEAVGPEAMYLFDCLSVLAEAWQSDRMMANFFRLTCPRLFDLDTVTYFGVFRNAHEWTAMEVITDTTQFLLDVFHCRGRLYLRPIKVRHGPAAVMHLIHAWEEGDRFRPVADSGTVAEILAGSGWPGLEDEPVVGRLVVSYDHLERSRVLVERGAHGIPDEGGRLVRGDDDREGGVRALHGDQRRGAICADGGR